MQPDVRVEQLLTIQRDTVWHADVSDASAGSGGVNRLHHRLLRADAFQHGICADALRQLLDARDAFVAALGDDIRRAELARKLLS